MNEKLKNICEKCNIPLRFGEDFYKNADHTKFSEDEIYDAMVMLFPHYQFAAKILKLAADTSNDEETQNNYINHPYNYLAEPEHVEAEKTNISENNADILFF